MTPISLPQASLSCILVTQKAGAVVKQAPDWLGKDLSLNPTLAPSHGVIPGQPLNPFVTLISHLQNKGGGKGDG